MQKYKLFNTSKSDTHTEFNEFIPVSGVNIYSGKDLKLHIMNIDEDYFFIYTKPNLPEFSYLGLERLVQIANDTNAGIVYSDFYEVNNNVKKPHPVIDYQKGSVRDDFDFGPLLLIKTTAAKDALNLLSDNTIYSGLYDLRLSISVNNEIFHLNEYIYTVDETEEASNEEKQFAYVDSKNRAVQIEMENTFTSYLKAIGAWMEPVFETPLNDNEIFDYEASVIIPVKNRVKTISDAINSVLEQKTDFKFNLIIIDNHSTDGTSDIIKNAAISDDRIVHIIPDNTDLGIGGCWNLGVQNVKCGKYAIQLDSDDVYSSQDTIQKIVDEFYKQDCAMLVGSYRMCNFNLETIPPGIIDHREWTEDNGRNNALRINGLGAPRAFRTQLLREIKVPNTSYGEDYALGLQFSRKWKIGRIYDVLYLCRRWDDNSDASIDQLKLNSFNFYKDKLRSIEITARQNINTSKNKQL
jgi:hypothetical protein